MTLHELFPYRVCVNLAFREDRRRRVWQRFEALGLEVDRQPGIPSRWVRDSWGFHRKQRYACSLAKRLAIRRAKLAGAPAVLLMEDDVVFAEDMEGKLEKIELPRDWQVFFLGCKHLGRPEPVAPGLVRVTRAADHHAIGIRAEVYDEVIRGLAGTGRGSPRTIHYSDVKLAGVLSRLRTVYAAFPNLAWQERSLSENAGKVQSFYDRHGRQLTELHAVNGLEDEMSRMSGNGEEADSFDTGGPEEAGGTQPASSKRLEAATEAPSPSVAERHRDPAQPPPVVDREPPTMDFLHGSPRRFAMEQMFPLRLYINLARREDRRHEIEWQFETMGLAVERLPAADGRLARNTRRHGAPNKYACRLSHRLALREGIRRGAPNVLVFEDDAVFHPEFRTLVEALPPPEDWGVLLFGCTHVQAPEVVAPGWVRVRHFWGLHAYAVRRRWFAKLLSVLNAKGTAGDPDDGTGTDVSYSQLSDEIPIYATYPNLSWQNEGYSDLMGIERKPFGDDGRQLRMLDRVAQANAGMRQLIEAEFGPIDEGTPSHGLLVPGHVFRGIPSPVGEKEDEWRQFERTVYINLAARGDRRMRMEEMLKRSGIEAELFEAVSPDRSPHTGGLSQGAYGCALSHLQVLRQAARQRLSSVLILEDDVELHPNLRQWLARVAIPQDWGILYLGCQHVDAPEMVSQGVVSVRAAYSTHAYAVRSRWFGRLRRTIRRGIREGLPCDVVLSGLHREIPTYALYPNLAWQSDGFSDLKDGASSAYGRDGVQKWHREVLRETDQKMKQAASHAWRKRWFANEAER